MAESQSLRMNQVQVVGTHNSYHIAPSKDLIKAAMLFDKGAAGWDYTHPPLGEQLDAGVRNFEIDLNHVDGEIRIFHVPHLDEGTHCPLFRECLQTVLAWSQANPRHLPLSFLLEIKDDYATWHKGMSAWDLASLEQMDAEIRAVFPEDKLITPDTVRGSHATLEEAVLAGNWPLLEEARGKVFFALHEQGRLREIYLEHRPSAEGRVCFPRSQPGAPYSAFIVADNPDTPEIPAWVRQGYYVRTRADGGLVRDGDKAAARRDRAIASGAHIVSTDYPPGSPHADNGYVVKLGGSGFACNSVNAPDGCAVIE
ncbi:MAG: hypothetical protein RLZZ303_3013 [Candidatus Hydrogenedentota bacterium]